MPEDNDTKRWMIIMFIACLLALMCVFALNWSYARSNDQYTLNLPVIFGNQLPTPAPTMDPMPTVVYPTPAPTPTPQVVCVEVWYENSHGLECSLSEWYEVCTTTCDDSGCRRECEPVFYPTPTGNDYDIPLDYNCDAPEGELCLKAGE